MIHSPHFWGRRIEEISIVTIQIILLIFQEVGCTEGYPLFEDFMSALPLLCTRFLVHAYLHALSLAPPHACALFSFFFPTRPLYPTR